MEQTFEVTVDEQTGEQAIENVTPEPQPVAPQEQLPPDYVEDDPVGVPTDYEEQPEEEGKEEEPEGEDPDALTDEINSNAKEANDVAEFMQEKGLDYDVLLKEYSERGELSEESYAKLKEAGIPRSMVDSYCAGQEALYARWCDHVKGYAGGEENYAVLMDYAAKTMTNREKTAYDAAVNSGDADRARIAVESLLYRYQQDNPYPQEADYEGYAGTREPPITGFTSPEEAYEMQEDPRMYTDPAFARLFNQRLMKTPFLTNN